MPLAGRVSDLTSHGTPLTPGPGAATVLIGYMPAWRALPSAMGSAVEGISNTMNSFMARPVMTPADATASLVQISQALVKGGAAAAANGAPGAAATAGSMVSTMNAANVALSTTWTTASAIPGGQPAANTAYTEGIKAAAAAAASAVMSAMAGLSDMHICPVLVPIPPHGPGFVTKGSPTVLIEKLSAARQGDKVYEACGGPDPIAIGCPTVVIGDSAGGGGAGSAAGAGAGWVAGAGAVPTTFGTAITIEGDAEYRRKVLAALAELDATPTGHALLQSIEASGRTVTIRAPAPGDGNSCGYDDPAARFTQADGTPGAGTNSTVQFNPDRDVIGPAAWETRPPAIGLGHELIHADQAAHGTTTPGTTNNDARPDPANPGAIQQTNTREVETTGVPPNDTRDFTENDLRREWDPPQPQRPWY